MNSRRPATGSFRIQPVPGSTPITRIINFTVAPRCSAALSGISALPADAIRSGVQSMRYRCKFRGLTESEAVNGQGCSTKPAIYFAQHQETRQTCSPTEDKRSLLSYFSIVFSRSLSHARIHTHTHTLCLFLSPLLPYYPTLFSLPFLLCFHYSPFVPTFSKPLSPLPDFSVSISNDDSIYGIALFLLPSPSFPSVCSFRLSVFAAALLRLFSALVRSFTLSRLMHFYRKLQVKTFR